MGEGDVSGSPGHPSPPASPPLLPYYWSTPPPHTQCTPVTSPTVPPFSECHELAEAVLKRSGAAVIRSCMLRRVNADLQVEGHGAECACCAVRRVNAGGGRTVDISGPICSGGATSPGMPRFQALSCSPTLKWLCGNTGDSPGGGVESRELDVPSGPGFLKPPFPAKHWTLNPTTLLPSWQRPGATFARELESAGFRSDRVSAWAIQVVEVWRPHPAFGVQ